MAKSRKRSLSSLVGLAKIRPLVCATIFVASSTDFLRASTRASKLECDLVELRIDHLKDSSLSDIGNMIKDSSLPVIATIRSKRDGGLIPESRESDRVNLLEAIVDCQPAFLDLEIELERSILQRLITQAHRAGVGIICSHHNLCYTPRSAKILKLLREIFKSKADIAKLVFFPNSASDVVRILRSSATFYTQEKLLTIFGMGKLGQYTRMKTTLLGSCLMYCSLDLSNNELGQLHVSSATKFVHGISKIEWRKERMHRMRTLDSITKELKAQPQLIYNI